MVVAALALSLLSQAGASPAPSHEIAVLVTRRVGLSEVRGQALARRVSDYLKAQGFDAVVEPQQAARQLAVMGVKDSADCEGKRECVAGLGRVLRAWGVVALDLADIDGTMAIHIEALNSDKGEKLAMFDVSLSSKKVEAELPDKLSPLSAALREALDALPRPAPAPVQPQAQPELKQPTDAPVATNLKPEPVPPPAVTESPPMPKAHVGALVTTAAAVVGAGLAILFVAQAGTAQRQLDQARVDRPNGAVGYNMTQSQAQALAGRVNDNYSAALGVGIGAAALAVTSAILWAQK